VLSVNPDKGKGPNVKEVKSALDVHILRDEAILKNAKTLTTAVLL
jgi:hypothetical protein